MFPQFPDRASAGASPLADREDMEELYPEEVRTPPVPLVALVGVPELHPVISPYLHSETPPINTLALPDFAKLSVIGAKNIKSVDPKSVPAGILKIDWLRKHRTRVPAVLVVLLNRDEVYGDPSQWLQVCTRLDNIKNVIQGRNTKLVVAIVQPAFLIGDSSSEDRLIALRKRADVDAKYFITFYSQESSEHKLSLSRLGNILSELVVLFYKEEGRMVKSRLERRALICNDLSIRYNFKVAVYAEFRKDWVEVLKFYEAAYSVLQEVASAPSELQSIQRIVELKVVADLLHFKISMLLLHSRKEAEAVKWFRHHINFYKPLVGPSESSFMHWEWLQKQFLVFGVLLQNSMTSPIQIKPASSALLEMPVTEHDLQPGYYYQVAAHCVIERRRSFQSSYAFLNIDGDHVDVLEGPPETLGLPVYFGQSNRFLPHKATDFQCPTDQEYLYHAIRQEGIFPHSAIAISLFNKAYEQFKLFKASRRGHYVTYEMGLEYFHARQYANAMQLLKTVAIVYREEAWKAILWATLGFLRECARQLRLLQEYIEYSLEMAALPTTDETEEEQNISYPHDLGPAGPLAHSQRKHVVGDIINVLQGTQSVLPPREGEIGMTVGESSPVVLNIDLASSLRAVLTVSASFHDAMIKPGTSTSLTLSLLSHLPLALDVDALEICFNQSSCNFVLTSCEEYGELFAGLVAKGGFDLHLEPNRWKRYIIEVSPGESGKFECLTVTAHIGKFCRISCQVESPASRVDDIFWESETHVRMLPIRDSSLSYFGQKTIQVEELDPLVDLVLEAMDGPALLGELFPIGIKITSKGHAIHAGELKFNIVESSPLLSVNSPGVTSPVGLPFLELLSSDKMPFRRDEFESKPFAGILMIPPIATEGIYSTKIYLRFGEVKPVILFVSFGYQVKMEASDDSKQPIQHSIRRSLQVQCEEPLILVHQYMLPFRKDALLLGSLKKPSAGEISRKACIAASETSTLVLTVKNASSVGLEVLDVTVEEVNDKRCSIRPMNPSINNAVSNFTRCLKREASTEMETASEHGSRAILPGESMVNLFYIRPKEASPDLAIATVHIKWQRLMKNGFIPNMDTLNETDLPATVVKRISLPAVQVEEPILLITFNCPPCATLGVPFDLSLCIENCTALLQEVKFMVVDAPAFILSGAHSDTIHILPYSKDVLRYKLISVASGMQQLPQLTLTATRSNAGFQQSVSSIKIFVVPSASIAV